MKIEINEKPVKREKPFPKLMRDKEKGWIVYFHADQSGILMVGETAYKEGEYYTDGWIMDDFEELPDDFTITLSNGGDDD